MQGWIKLHRKIQESKIWDNNEPFDRRSAWIDLLLFANHEDKNIIFNGKVITVKRGERITSVLALSERWNWSRHKVSDFLNLLESEQMIVQKRDNKKTLITSRQKNKPLNIFARVVLIVPIFLSTSTLLLSIVYPLFVMPTQIVVIAFVLPVHYW
jgi:hypothetical protein